VRGTSGDQLPVTTAYGAGRGQTPKFGQTAYRAKSSSVRAFPGNESVRGTSGDQHPVTSAYDIIELKLNYVRKWFPMHGVKWRPIRSLNCSENFSSIKPGHPIGQFRV
jgi:hypothetical protein